MLKNWEKEPLCEVICKYFICTRSLNMDPISPSGYMALNRMRNYVTRTWN
jgi:hypothetical protein